MPVVATTGAWDLTVQKLWMFRSCSVDALLVQFIDGCGRPCDHAATVATVEVPQIQLSPLTVDIPVVQQRRVLDLQQCWLWRR